VSEHFNSLRKETPFSNAEEEFWVQAKAIIKDFRMSYSQVRNICLWLLDLNQWDQEFPVYSFEKPVSRKEYYSQLVSAYQSLLERRDYSDAPPLIRMSKVKKVSVSPPKNVIGDCPVASERTRCCYLQTLDAVAQCAYDCTYCSIQAFYHGNEVQFIRDLDKALSQIHLEPQEFYHIGTGQSSDSLVWGNENGTLEKLFSWAEANPNVILELKSKSSRVKEALQIGLPSNVLSTWSLNPQKVIDWEERGTAGIQERIAAARSVADQGGRVGFHFHPIITYQGWEGEYQEIAQNILSNFEPSEVVTISFGALTFTKKVINQIRGRKIKSKILQMPLVEAAGKLSLPLNNKRDIFSKIFHFFSDWHQEVYFYLCMEDPQLWPLVFGRDYADNRAFQKDMILSYRNKMGLFI
jgi:spore photoproduct lyase